MDHLDLESFRLLKGEFFLKFDWKFRNHAGRTKFENF